MAMLMHPEAVASLPLWAAGLLMAALAVGGAVVVELLARRLVPLTLRQENATVASAMFTVIGTTYAVLLAFVAMLAWDGFNKAQAVTDGEAARLQNIYQLVDGVDGAEMASMRAEVIAYAHAVIETEWPLLAGGGAVPDDQPSLRRLAMTVLHLPPAATMAPDLRSLLLGEVVALAGARRERLLAARTQLPAIIWFVLIAGGGITVAFGSFLGASSLRMHLAMSSLLAISGALVLLVIVALSNPFRGDESISADPFARVLVRMAPG